MRTAARRTGRGGSDSLEVVAAPAAQVAPGQGLVQRLDVVEDIVRLQCRQLQRLQSRGAAEDKGDVDVIFQGDAHVRVDAVPYEKHICQVHVPLDKGPLRLRQRAQHRMHQVVVCLSQHEGIRLAQVVRGAARCLHEQVHDGHRAAEFVGPVLSDLVDVRVGVDQFGAPLQEGAGLLGARPRVVGPARENGAHADEVTMHTLAADAAVGDHPAARARSQSIRNSLLHPVLAYHKDVAPPTVRHGPREEVAHGVGRGVDLAERHLDLEHVSQLLLQLGLRIAALVRDNAERHLFAEQVCNELLRTVDWIAKLVEDPVHVQQESPVRLRRGPDWRRDRHPRLVPPRRESAAGLPKDVRLDSRPDTGGGRSKSP
mmetsp:Transcript_126093/g.403040  ORF Transcript_126093/g.403040 Transcript_126093/m.403040 type:complete len:371 (-) Transcript_126093:137-1249(-)